jgi:hypothetical protein
VCSARRILYTRILGFLDRYVAHHLLGNVTDSVALRATYPSLKLLKSRPF